MILNLTQHRATPEQVEAGVVDLPEAMREVLMKALTFEDLPSPEEIQDRAWTIANLAMEVCDDIHRAAWNATQAGQVPANASLKVATMIGGAPFLMSTLERELAEAGLEPAYAFSRREVVEQPQADGSVRKMAVFRHVGFVPAVL